METGGQQRRHQQVTIAFQRFPLLGAQQFGPPPHGPSLCPVPLIPQTHYGSSQKPMSRTRVVQDALGRAGVITVMHRLAQVPSAVACPGRVAVHASTAGHPFP
jgi:hypothetical protein